MAAALRMWNGGTLPHSFPHLCPYQIEGATKEQCVEISGRHPEINKGGCFGTWRSELCFLPCNSAMRRCIVCLTIGRRGTKAGAVTDFETGTCDEHSTQSPIPISVEGSTESDQTSNAKVEQLQQNSTSEKIVVGSTNDTTRLKSGALQQKVRKIRALKKGKVSGLTRDEKVALLHVIREEVRGKDEKFSSRSRIARIAAPRLHLTLASTAVFISQLSEEEQEALDFYESPGQKEARRRRNSDFSPSRVY